MSARLRDDQFHLGYANGLIQITRRIDDTKALIQAAPEESDIRTRLEGELFALETAREAIVTTYQETKATNEEQT